MQTLNIGSFVVKLVYYTRGGVEINIPPAAKEKKRASLTTAKKKSGTHHSINYQV